MGTTKQVNCEQELLFASFHLSSLFEMAAKIGCTKKKNLHTHFSAVAADDH